MSKQLRLDVAQLTDVGRKRPHNEDNMAYVIPKDERVMTKKGALFIVADGMGGHAAGEVASEIAVDTVSNAYYQDDNDDIPLSLMNAIKRTNALIHQRAAENMQRSGMGTTCIATVLCGNLAYVANVGDSRAYIVRRGSVRQISQDHSWVEEQVRAGLLTKEQARSHSQRNVITRSLGTQAEVEVDIFSEHLEIGDTLILCSDGLSGPVPEEDLLFITDKYMPQESVYHLVERANDNGGPDNITAIVVRVQELGEEMPESRYPVQIGGRIADEKTTVLGRLPASSTGTSTRTDDKRPVTAPLAPLNGAHAPASAYASTPPQTPFPAQSASRRRSRLLFPSLALSLVLVLALAAGVYYLLRPSGAQSSLDRASALIAQAKRDHDSKPENSLQNLQKAQTELKAVKKDQLNQDQTQQFALLQNSLTAEFKTSLANYNKQSLITALPCVDGQPTPMNLSGASVQPLSMVTIKGEKSLFSYVLGSDTSLYRLEKDKLTKLSSVPGKIVLMTYDSQHVITLTQESNQSYKLALLKPETNGNLSVDEDATKTLNTDMLKGFSPQFMTAWDKDIYLFSASSQNGQNQAKILAFKSDKLTDEPRQAATSISTGVVGIAAWPDNKLFLLHKDGHVKSLVMNATNVAATEVVLQNTVQPLWSTDAKNFSSATPIATPTSQISRSLIIPAPSATALQSLLSSGQVNNTPHLFVVDNSSHRVLDLSAFAGGGVGGTNNAASISLQLVQQYASATVLATVRSIGVDPAGAQLNLLTIDALNPAVTNIVAVGVSPQKACTSAS